MLSKILPLEVLTNNEVELATTTLALTRCRVEAPTPVDTHHTDNWQLEANTDTGRTLNLKWREVLPRRESVTSLKEAEHIDL